MPLNLVDVNPVALESLFLLVVSCGMVCSWLFHTIRLEIDAKLPDEKKVSALFGYPGLLSKVMHLHKEHYPQSKLRMVLMVFIGLGVASLLGLAFTMNLL